MRKTLKQKIERCESIMARTKPIWEAPNEIPGAFVTGRSNRSRSLDRRLDAENNRMGRAFNEYEAARKEHARLTELLKDVEAGERHENGQRRVDAPSRATRKQTQRRVEDLLHPFLKTHLQPGQQAGTVHGTIFTVKRVNPKSITSTTVYYGEVVKYELTEVLLIGDDGKPLPISVMAKRVSEWHYQNDKEQQP